MSAAAWNELDLQVLTVFGDGRARDASTVQRDLPEVPGREVRAVLRALAQDGRLRPARGAVRTGYVITPAGQDSLAGDRAEVA